MLSSWVQRQAESGAIITTHTTICALTCLAAYAHDSTHQLGAVQVNDQTSNWRARPWKRYVMSQGTDIAKVNK